MTDILAQIGDKLGSKIKELEAQISSGGGGGGGNDHSHSEPSDDYTESTFSSGVLTAMTTYTSSLKTTLVGSKAFSYNTDGLLTSVVQSDENGATNLTKTITYDSSGNLESVTKDYA